MHSSFPFIITRQVDGNTDNKAAHIITVREKEYSAVQQAPDT